MRSSLLALLATGTVATALTVSVAAPQPPGPKPLPIFILRDLAIETLGVTMKAGGTTTGPSQLATIEVTVKDWCKAPGQIGPYVQASVYASKGGKTLAIVGENVQIINGQNGHASLSLSQFAIPASAYIYAEVDPQNKIAEVSDANNYQSRTRIRRRSRRRRANARPSQRRNSAPSAGMRKEAALRPGLRPGRFSL